MSQFADTLFLNVSPSFKKFDRPLIQYLSQHQTIAQWEYQQTLDEPISLDTAIALLHDYLQHCDHPIHLVGHSTSGLLGLLYARRYPERVKSLTLLSVGVHPAIDWQAHYYVTLQMLPCSREMILAQTIYNLFGYKCQSKIRYWIEILKKDLATSLSPHTLFNRVSIPPGGVPVPLFVCGSQNDVIVDLHQFQSWNSYLKEEDRLWHCPQGRHFFHYFYPQETGERIAEFWNSISSSSIDLQIPVCT
ncbi:MAG TPA: alpha/beta hydrolase [Oscillatoriales cyanobacterium M59_W2019_021]|nr:MAG: alpha/beta hydrolase [Cyanobacteria bacterium J055]HIK33868.1 alpha/beta hydrolase [Oscillatoriales cyanobacterium M4454_W2019_049]HIK51696.1 alpha/beta hydrolase [Oscillatoriales cyanobacterium M59_W2019_021]